jgi:hypothetical protein
MHKTILIISFIAITIDSTAQEVRRVQRTQKIEVDTTLYHVHEYSTKEAILSLLKPSEIIMKRRLDPEVSQRIMDLYIQILDTSHVVLKYFKYQASMQLGKRNFKHNEFPKSFNPGWIAGMHYIASPNHEQDILEVQLFPQNSGPLEKITHKLHSNAIQYYAVDGQVVTKDEMANLNLAIGTFEMGSTIYGKEASEKYGDPKYAQGVQEILKIKKP